MRTLGPLWRSRGLAMWNSVLNYSGTIPSHGLVTRGELRLRLQAGERRTNVLRWRYRNGGETGSTLCTVEVYAKDALRSGE